MACPHVVPNSARPHDLLAVPPRCAAGWRRLGYWLPPRALLLLARAEAPVHAKNLHPRGKPYATYVLSFTHHFPHIESSQIRIQRPPGTSARQGGDYRPRAHQAKHEFPCGDSRPRVGFSLAHCQHFGLRAALFPIVFGCRCFRKSHHHEITQCGYLLTCPRRLRGTTLETPSRSWVQR